MEPPLFGAQHADVELEEFSLANGLKWARRMRLDLAFEIQKLQSGVWKVTEMTANGPVDVTSQVLAAQQNRFEHLEEMIAAFSDSAHRA